MSSNLTVMREELQMCGEINQRPSLSPDVLRVLYLSHYRHVLQICRKYFRQPEDAEDATAEVFLKLYRVLHQKNELVPFRAWISRIAAHHCIDKLRRRKHERSSSLEEVDVNGLLDHSTPSALSEVLRNEAEGRIRRALAALPEKHRTVLVLRYYDRMSYSQIAEALDMPLSAIRVRIFRAKRSLRGNLRRSNRADHLAKQDPERSNRAPARNDFRRFNVPVSSGMGSLYPVTT